MNKIEQEQDSQWNKIVLTMVIMIISGVIIIFLMDNITTLLNSPIEVSASCSVNNFTYQNISEKGQVSVIEIFSPKYFPLPKDMNCNFNMKTNMLILLRAK
jgi:cytochrome b subunit of formate dehydrogenase